MYVCLCKALKEADVVIAAQACIKRGSIELNDVIEVLGLQCEEACGFCTENPDTIQAIVEDQIELSSFGRALTEVSIS
jgi:bacterioferritin-associated ferredoxin